MSLSSLAIPHIVIVIVVVILLAIPHHMLSSEGIIVCCCCWPFPYILVVPFLHHHQSSLLSGRGSHWLSVVMCASGRRARWARAPMSMFEMNGKEHEGRASASMSARALSLPFIPHVLALSTSSLSLSSQCSHCLHHHHHCPQAIWLVEVSLLSSGGGLISCQSSTASVIIIHHHMEGGQGGHVMILFLGAALFLISSFQTTSLIPEFLSYSYHHYLFILGPLTFTVHAL